MVNVLFANWVPLALGIILLVGDFPAASALLPNGGDKSSLHGFGCGGCSRKTFPGKEEYGEVLIHSKKEGAFRRLRSSISSSPPAPVTNQRKSMESPGPPPLVL